MVVASPFPSWRIRAAWGADLAAASGTWTWTDIPASDVRSAEGSNIVISRGRRSASTQAEPANLTFSLHNARAQYTPGHPSGFNFPNVRQNTPLQVYANPGSGEVLRGTFYVDSWTPRWDSTMAVAWVDVSASGQLRRLGQGNAPLRSALFRSISGDDPQAYWSLEDASGSASAASAVEDGPLIWTRNPPSLGSGGPAGSAGALTMAEGTDLFAAVTHPTTTTAWSMQFVLNIPATPTAVSQILHWRTPTGTYTHWAITLFPGGGTDTWGVEVFDQGGLRVVDEETNFTIGTLVEPYGYDLLVTVSAKQVGANVQFQFAGFEPTTGQSAGKVGLSFAGTLGRITDLFLEGGFDHHTGGGWEYSHISVWDRVLFSSWGATGAEHEDALDGYSGETAGARLLRLCTEQGIAVDGSAGYLSATAAMGPQGTATLVTLLRECEAADGGILYDGLSPELRYRSRTSRYNLTAALTASISGLQLGEPFQPVFDDLKHRNDWTVSRTGGSSAHVADAADVAASGLYDDSVALNVEDDTGLGDQAGWRVNLGTVQGLRYPSLTLLFMNANAQLLLASWLAMDIGDRVTVTGLPSQLPPNVIDLVVEGCTETIGFNQWDVTMSCTPFAPWRVFTIEDSSLGRLGATNSSLLTAVSSSATSLAVVTRTLPKWTTSPASMDIDVAGEQMTVTAVSNTAATFIANSTGVTGDNTSLTPALPAGLAPGDLLLIYIATRADGTGYPDDPDGYEVLLSMGGNAVLYGKIAEVGEVAATITFSNTSAGDTVTAQTAAFRNASLTVANSATQANGSAQNIAYPDLVVPADNCLILYLGWKADDWTSIATLAGATEIGEPDSILGNDQGIVWDYKIQTTAADIASGSFTVTGGTSAVSRGGVVALRTDVGQTFTVTRAVNGVSKAQAAGTAINLWRPGVIAL